MGKINLGRVILGGLVAGVVINLFEGIFNAVVLKQEMESALTALRLNPAFSTKQIAFFTVAGFAIGILLVLTYALMRPRLGAGVNTALCAGALVWAVGNAIPNSFNAVMHVFPLALLLKGTAVGLVETLIAAALYKEDGAPQTMSAGGGR